MSIFAGVGINLTSIIKWTLRSALLIFLVVGILLYMNGFDIFTPLLTHVTTTLVLVGLGCLAFLPLIVPKPKKRNTQGGEEVMKKFYLAIMIIVAVLTIFGVAMWLDTEGTKAAVGGVGGGLGEGLVNAGEGVNAFLGTTFPPYLNVILGVVGGIGLTVLLTKIDIPKKIRFATGKPKEAPINEPSKKLQSGLINTQPLTPQDTGTILVEEETK